ncbi:glycosyltransferase family 4 protein [Pontixanthobacter gangjinensis]|uniref:Colanic acid biosynthesis glycosyltransferase WcaL n=1 Tax=Christiangramia aestuarii TaxID=1028746 RepID=A0A7K1LM22_9FLAO|nr:glycosyltransferase [Christiangramia aestuarii]MUP41788.1 colanic acid biosynthesis glycosyltransferase WcaL [Christiangramia aestuarii]
MRGKTIIFRIWKFPATSETFVINQILIAKSCGYEVKILVEDLQDIDNSIHREIIRSNDLESRIITENYKIPRIKILRILKGSLLLIRNWKNLRFIKKFSALQKDKLSALFKFSSLKYLNNYDLIHVQYGTNVKPLDQLKRIGFLKTPLLVSFHGHDLVFPINGRIPEKGYYDDLFKYGDRLVVNTPYLEDILLKLGASSDNIEIIPAGIDTNFFRPNNSSSKKANQISLITVGRLEYLKGQHLGIECVKVLKEKGYEVSYDIIGSGSKFEDLKDLVNIYNLNEYVTFWGNKSADDIKNLLQKSDIFLMTSITDPKYGSESQGLVTAEAQACGLPVVAFDSGGVKYTVDPDHSGFLIPEGDVQMMVSFLEKLINDESLRLIMGKQARKFVKEKFSNDRLLQKWESLYKATLKS